MEIIERLSRAYTGVCIVFCFLHNLDLGTKQVMKE